MEIETKSHQIYNVLNFEPMALHHNNRWRSPDLILEPVTEQFSIMLKIKPLFISPVLKTEWYIRCSIIGERPPNWCAKKLLSVIGMVNQPFSKFGNVSRFF